MFRVTIMQHATTVYCPPSLPPYTQPSHHHCTRSCSYFIDSFHLELLFVHDMIILCPSITYTVTDKTKDPHLPVSQVPVKYGFTRGFLTLFMNHSGNFYTESHLNRTYSIPFYVLPFVKDQQHLGGMHTKSTSNAENRYHYCI